MSRGADATDSAQLGRMKMSRSPFSSDRRSTSAAALAATAAPRPMFEALEDRMLFSTAVGVSAAAVPWASSIPALTASATPTSTTAAVTTPITPKVSFPGPIGPGKQLGGNLQFQAEYTNDHALSDLVKATSGFKSLTGGAAQNG